MELDKLTIKSQEFLQSAHDMAQNYGNQAIEPIHFLKVMVEDEQGIAQSIFKKIGARMESLKKESQAAIEKLVTVSGDASLYLSQKGKKILDQSFLETQKMKDRYVSLEHRDRFHAGGY